MFAAGGRIRPIHGESEVIVRPTIRFEPRTRWRSCRIRTNFGHKPFMFNLQEYSSSVGGDVWAAWSYAHNLPLEIIHRILTFLADTTPLLASQIWSQSCIASRPALFRTVEIATLTRLEEFIQMLGDSTTPYPSTSSRVPPIGPHIKKLIIQGDAAVYVDRILCHSGAPSLSNLKKLEWSTDESHSSSILTCLPSNFTAKFLRLFQQFDHATTLTLRNQKFQSYRQFVCLVSSMPRLEFLDLESVSWEDSILLSQRGLIRRPPSLRKIYYWQMTDDSRLGCLWLFLGPSERRRRSTADNNLHSCDARLLAQALSSWMRAIPMIEFKQEDMSDGKSGACSL